MKILNWLRRVIKAYSHRKVMGAKFGKSEKIPVVQAEKLKSLRTGFKGTDHIDNNNTRGQVQKYASCVVHNGFVPAMESRIAFERKDDDSKTFVYIDATALSEIFIKAGILSKFNGMYLADAAEWINDNLIQAQDGTWWDVTVKRVARSEVDASIVKGYQVITGSSIEYPFFDEKTNYALIAPKGGGIGGHCWRYVGKLKGICKILANDSWKEWGMVVHNLPTGQAYVDPAHESRTFEYYIIEDVEEVVPKSRR